MKKIKKFEAPHVKKQNRFREFNPDEVDALRILIQNHLNTISEISLHKDFRVIGYLDWLANIEQELIDYTWG